jgi:hypothetical protein
MKLHFTFDPKFFDLIPSFGASGFGVGKGLWHTKKDPEDEAVIKAYATGTGKGQYEFRPDGQGCFWGYRNSFWAGSSGVTISTQNSTATISRYYDDESYVKFEMPITITEVYTSTPDDIIVEGVPHFLY